MNDLANLSLLPLLRTRTAVIGTCSGVRTHVLGEFVRGHHNINHKLQNHHNRQQNQQHHHKRRQHALPSLHSCQRTLKPSHPSLALHWDQNEMTARRQHTCTHTSHTETKQSCSAGCSCQWMPLSVCSSLTKRETLPSQRPREERTEEPEVEVIIGEGTLDGCNCSKQQKMNWRIENMRE